MYGAVASLSARNQFFKRVLIDRRASHLAQIYVSEKLQDGQVADGRVHVVRTVEDVAHYFNHLHTQDPIQVKLRTHSLPRIRWT